jgi:di/tricarboxylate transporter
MNGMNMDRNHPTHAAVDAARSAGRVWIAVVTWTERIAAVAIGQYCLTRRIPELGATGLSASADALYAWGCIAVVTTLVTLVWVARVRWRVLRTIAWIVLLLMATGIGR